MRGKAFSAVLLILAACATPSFGSIAVVSATNYSEVYSNGTSYSDFANTWPAATTSASHPNGSSSSTLTNCLPMSLSAVFDQRRWESNNFDTRWPKGELIVGFQAQSNDSYSIHGSFGEGTSPLNTHLDVRAYLYNRTTGIMVVHSYQYGAGSPGGVTIGGSYAGAGSYLTGSLTGTLVAGDQYEFGIIARMGTNAPDVARGSGGIQFFSAVPEPGSLIVWGALGALGLVVTTTRRIARGSQPVENTSTRREQVS